MKKIFFHLPLILISVLMLVSSCQKSVTESNSDVVAKVPDESLKNKCQLTAMYIEGFNNRFHYNDKGLADEWRIDYGDGIYHDVFTMSYDDNNHLSQALYHYDGFQVATIDFTWKNNRLTKEQWDYSGFPFEVENIYDVKGQLVKREITTGFTAETQYSANGNIPIRDILYNGELIRRGEYTFNQPNKNPFLAIQGIPYGFPFISFDFSPWWETSEKITEYYGGTPFTFLDEDPAQTVMNLGFQNHPTAVDHFDVISNSPLQFTFEYQNCGPEANAPTKIGTSTASSTVSSRNTITKKLSLIKTGPPEMMKKQFEQIRRK